MAPVANPVARSRGLAGSPAPRAEARSQVPGSARSRSSKVAAAAPETQLAPLGPLALSKPSGRGQRVVETRAGAPKKRTSKFDLDALSRKDILAAKLPSPFFARFTRESESAVLDRLANELSRLEAEVGNNDKVLVPRDLDDARAVLRQLMFAVVYPKEGGAKSIPLTRVRARIMMSAGEFLNRRDVRSDAAVPEYVEFAREALGWLRESFHQSVILGETPPDTFLREAGFSDSRSRALLRRHLPGLLPTATLEELAMMWPRVLDDQLSRVAFYSLAGMSAAQFEKLRTKHPDLFPNQRAAEGSRTNGNAGPREPAIGAFLGLVNEYLEEDVLIGRDQIIARANRDKDFVKQFGLVTTGRYKHWQKVAKDFPDLRSPKVWVEALAQEIRELLAEQPGLSRADVLHALRKRHPSISKHHIETVSAAHRGLFQTSDSSAQVEETGRLARELAKKDVMITREAIVEQINANPKYVAKFGELTFEKYRYLGVRPNADFPRLRDRSTWLPLVESAIEKLFARDPTLTDAQLVERLLPKFPSINLTRIGDVRKANKALFERRATQIERQSVSDPKLVQRVRRVLEKNPGLTHAQILARLEPDFPKLTIRQVGSIIAKLRPELSPKVVAKLSDRDTARQVKSVAKLYEIIVRLFPPGTKQEILLAALNAELEKRGVAPFNSLVFQQTRLTSLDVHLGVAAKLLAEYARAAPKGTPADEILNRIEDDYPTLTRMALRHYWSDWTKDPKRFPELAPFIKGGKVELRGLGLEVAKPRFIGGWDVNRAVLGGDRQENDALAELGQHARIPLHLPMLDAIVEDQKGGTPFATKNILMVSHFLASSVPMTLAMKKLGARFENTIMVGTPYGSNPTAVENVRGMGFDLRVPPLDEAAYKAAVEKALDEMVAKHRKNGETIVVLDDGGLVADILHRNMEKYADVIGAFKLVEQTTGGLLLAEKHDLQVPIIKAAKARAKIREGELIGRAVATKVRQGLERLSKSLDGQSAIVTGFGTIGQATAKELRAANVDVLIVEPNDTKRRLAKSLGFRVAAAPPLEALRKTDLFIGTTGERTLTLEQMRELKSGVIVASASSKQAEFAMGDLRKAASNAREIPSDTPLVTLPTKEYTLGGKKLIAMGDGWPVNFDGDVGAHFPQEIQLTRAIMLSGALQASKLLPGGKNKGFLEFDRDEDALLLTRFEKMRSQWTGAHPLRDPSKWREVYLDMAKCVESFGEIQSIGSRERSRARYLEPKVHAWFAQNPLMKTRDLVEIINADEEHVARFGELSEIGYTNMKKWGTFPNLRNGEPWIPIVLEEVKRIMAKKPIATRAELRAELAKKWPLIKKYHVDRLGAEHDFIPNGRPELPRSRRAQG